MNCKPGDLAVVLRSDFPETVGMLCRVLKTSHLDAELGFCWAVRFPRSVSWECWETGAEVHGRSGMVPDAWLRPIRDNDGEDESLTWAGKPEQVTA